MFRCGSLRGLVLPVGGIKEKVVALVEAIGMPAA
jgi:ATP-dependent Lon protease